MSYLSEEKRPLMEAAGNRDDDVMIPNAAPLMSSLMMDQGRHYEGNMIIRIIVSVYLWIMLPLGIFASFVLQCLAYVFLWPVFYFRPSFKVWLLGWLFRTCVTTTAFFLNPFWRIKYVRRSTAKHMMSGETLVMCNHTTQADPWIFARGLFPMEFKWVFKAELLKIPIVSQVLKMAHDIPLHFTKDKGGWGVERGQVQSMMKTVYDLGHVYDMGTVIFPEGTRSKTGRLLPFKDGFFKFAVENQRTILPCVSHNAQSLWPLGHVLFGYGTVYFSTGDPIVPYAGETSDSLKYRVREAMIDLLVQMPLYDQRNDEPFPNDYQVHVERGQGILGARV